MLSIVYASKTGTCKRYAEELSERIGVPCYPVGKAPSEGPVVFIGWLRGKFLVGSNKVAPERVKAVCVVGLLPRADASKIALNNNLKAPAYYLRGAVDRSRLGVFDKLILAVVCAVIKLKGFNDTTREMFDVMMEGGSFYDVEQLNQIERFLKK